MEMEMEKIEIIYRNFTYLLVVVYGNGNGKNRNYIQEFYLLTSSSREKMKNNCKVDVSAYCKNKSVIY